MPTAMAAATPATIRPAGGEVVLDAFGSGGAWGTNVTYAWALTDPSTGVTVTYDPDAASARTTATVPGSLTDGSTLTFTLTVTGRGDSDSGPYNSTATADVGVNDPSATDATLSGLALEDASDDSGLTLDPTFATGTTSYTVSVANGVDTVTVKPTVNESNATVAYLDGSDAAIADADGNKDDQQVALEVGANTIKVKVTAQNTTSTETYTVTVARRGEGICGRTLAVQTAIIGKISGVSACADVTTAHLAAITGHLDLSRKSITVLAAEDFAGLTSLTVLSLYRNTLTGLPAGVFDELTSLTRVNLSNNTLTELPAGVFDELTELTELSLYDNPLTGLPAGVFDKLTSLDGLELHRNHPDGAVRGRVRRADGADVSGSGLQRPGVGARRRVRQTDGAGLSEHGFQRPDVAARRRVRRADGADGAASGCQRVVDSARSPVREADGTKWV